MGESAARKLRRQKEQAASRQAAASTAAPKRPKSRVEEPEEINFMLSPGGLLQPEGAPMLVRKAKTVRIPGPLNVHLQTFQARHGGERVFAFERTAIALWRMLLREEHDARESARREMAATGLPAQPVMGPLYRAVLAEMEEMRREDSGEIFDED